MEFFNSYSGLKADDSINPDFFLGCPFISELNGGERSRKEEQENGSRGLSLERRSNPGVHK